VNKIREIATRVREKMEKSGCKAARNCVHYTHELVKELRKEGYDAQHVMGVVYFDEYPKDDDAWNYHHWAMVDREILVDISGDQFNGRDADGFVMIEDPRRIISRVNVVAWDDVMGDIYDWTEDGPLEIT
jgi:hypothetical protein